MENNFYVNAESFWNNAFDKPVENLQFIKDFNKEAKVKEYKFELSEEIFNQINKITKKNDMALYIFLLTVYKVLLSKYFDTSTISVSSYSQDEDNKITPIITHLSQDETFKEVLFKVRTNVISSFEFSNYPFVDIMNAANIDINLLSKNICLLENLYKVTYDFDINNQTCLSFKKVDDILQCKFIYSDCYHTNSIESLAIAFQEIINSVLNNVNIKISNICLVSKNINDYKVNNNKISEQTIIEAFEHQVEINSNKIALSTILPIADMYNSRSYENLRLEVKYDELNKRVNKLANFLIRQGIKKNEVVCLSVDHSIEKVIAMFAVLKSGAAFLPLNPNLSDEKICNIIKETKVRFMLYDDIGKVSIYLNIEKCFRIDDPEIFVQSTENPNIKIHSDDLAYIMFTSGSTGEPKGVLINHYGILNYAKWRIDKYALNNEEVSLQLLSYYFDGFGSNIYSCLLSGGNTVIVPDSKKMDYSYITKILEEYNITNISLVPLMYDSLIETVPSSVLHSLKFVVLAGDLCTSSLIEKSKIKMAEVSLYNEYGPTETSITATANLNYSESNTNIIGKPIYNTEVLICNRNGENLPMTFPGEIYITGVGVSRGYLNNVELTSKKFSACKANDSIYYKTGDRGRINQSGELEFLGRFDRQVKVRGYRIELEEVEKVIQSYPGIRQNSTILEKDSNTLSCFCTTNSFFEEKEIKKYLEKRLPKYMIPNNFYCVDRIPFNHNMKIDYESIAQLKKDKGNISTSFDIFEAKVAQIWANVLEVKIEQVQFDSNFFELGGHSLKVTIYVAKVHKELGIEIQMVDIFDKQTFNEQIEFLRIKVRTQVSTILPSEKKEYYELSKAQKRMYLTYLMDPESMVYNGFHILGLDNKISKSKIEKVFNEIIKRHQSFRSSFIEIDGRPVQKIYDKIDFIIKHVCLKSEEVNSYVNDFQKPFNLTIPCQINAALIEVESGDNIKKYLIIDVYHIISDGYSINIFIKEFNELIEGKDILPQLIQYKDYAEWQNSEAFVNLLIKQERFWIDKFIGAESISKFPTDYKRGNIKHSSGKFIKVVLPNEIKENIYKIVNSNNTTLSTFFVVVLNILLYKYTNSKTNIIGIPVSGRNHPNVLNIIGMFINMLAVVEEIDCEISFLEQIEKTKKTMLDAFENQDFPYEELVRKLNAHGKNTNSTLFDIVFQVRNYQGKEVLNIISRNNQLDADNIYNMKTTPMDLLLEVEEIYDGLILYLSFTTSLFKETTMKLLLSHYLEIVNQVLNNSQIQIKEIQLTNSLLVADDSVIVANNEEFVF